MPAIYYAINRGKFEIAELLLSQCTYLSNLRVLYLMEATRNPSCPLSLIKKLVNLGCNVNEEKNGFTPIFNLAYHGDVEKIKYFIEKGANLQQINNFGVSIVANCVCSPTFNIEALIVLIENGADYLTIDRDGESVVDSAKGARMPHELVSILNRAFKKEIDRNEFIDELKKYSLANTPTTDFSIEKMRSEKWEEIIHYMNVPAKPDLTNLDEFTMIYTLAVSGDYKNALVRATIMMDDSKISIMLLFVMACCFKALKEEELFRKYRDFFLKTTRKNSQYKIMSVLMLENRVGMDDFYRVPNALILFKHVF